MERIAETLLNFKEKGMLHGGSAGKILTAFARLASITEWLQADHPNVARANPEIHNFDPERVQAVVEKIDPLWRAFLHTEPGNLKTEGLSDRYQAMVLTGQEPQRAATIQAQAA